MLRTFLVSSSSSSSSAAAAAAAAAACFSSANVSTTMTTSPGISPPLSPLLLVNRRCPAASSSSSSTSSCFHSCAVAAYSLRCYGAAASSAADDDDSGGGASAAPPKQYTVKLSSNCPFECLGLEKNGTTTVRDVKCAYRQAAHKHHPDKGGEPENFRRIQNAQQQCVMMIESGYHNVVRTTASNNTKQPAYDPTADSPHAQPSSTQKAKQSAHYQSNWDAQAKARYRQQERVKREKQQQKQRAQEETAARHRAAEAEAKARSSGGSGGGQQQDGEQSQFSDRARQEWFHRKQQESEKQFRGDEAEFGDDDWKHFRSEWLSRRVFTPSEALKMSFAHAVTVKEIDDLFVAAIESRLFDESDPGLPLFLALNQYHWTDLGLGDAHVQHCMWAIAQWQKRYNREIPCFYYQIILAPYCDAMHLHRNPDLDSSMVYELVVRIVETMQEKASDKEDTNIHIGRCWETLRLAVKNRGGVTASGFRDPFVWDDGPK